MYDLHERRQIDADLVDKSVTFMRKHVAKDQPFFLYHPMVHLHFPT